MLHKPIKSLPDYADIQRDLDLIYEQSKPNRLSFNPSKCKFMISRKKTHSLDPLQLVLHTSPIKRVNSFKYLGLTLSSTLSCGVHIHHICTKAQKMIGLLYRHFYLNLDTSSLLQLYLSLVRPLLEYACQVLHPHMIKDDKKLKNVKKLALRLCTKQWNLDIETLLLI